MHKFIRSEMVKPNNESEKCVYVIWYHSNILMWINFSQNASTPTTHSLTIRKCLTEISFM